MRAVCSTSDHDRKVSSPNMIADHFWLPGTSPRRNWPVGVSAKRPSFSVTTPAMAAARRKRRMASVSPSSSAGVFGPSASASGMSSFAST